MCDKLGKAAEVQESNLDSVLSPLLFFFLVLRNVLLFNGPPCNRRSFLRYFQNCLHRSRQHSTLKEPQVYGGEKGKTIGGIQ